jgi:hypothetical protein
MLQDRAQVDLESTLNSSPFGGRPGGFHRLVQDARSVSAPHSLLLHLRHQKILLSAFIPRDKLWSIPTRHYHQHTDPGAAETKVGSALALSLLVPVEDGVPDLHSFFTYFLGFCLPRMRRVEGMEHRKNMPPGW